MGRSDSGPEAEARLLIARLEQAFEGPAAPASDRVVYDNSGAHLECAQIRAKFAGRHWRELGIDDLEGEADALAFFTPEAFDFYLPAFIRAAVLHPIRADLIPDAIVGAVGGWRRRRWSPERRAALLRAARRQGIPEESVDALESAADLETEPHGGADSLSAEQKRAVAGFLAYLRRHRPGDFEEVDLSRAERRLAAAP